MLSGHFPPLFAGFHLLLTASVLPPRLLFNIIPSHFPESSSGCQNVYFLNSHCWPQQDIGRTYLTALEYLYPLQWGEPRTRGRCECPGPSPATSWLRDFVQISSHLWTPYSKNKGTGLQQGFSSYRSCWHSGWLLSAVGRSGAQQGPWPLPFRGQEHL